MLGFIKVVGRRFWFMGWHLLDHSGGKSRAFKPEDQQRSQRAAARTGWSSSAGDLGTDDYRLVRTAMGRSHSGLLRTVVAASNLGHDTGDAGDWRGGSAVGLGSVGVDVCLLAANGTVMAPWY